MRQIKHLHSLIIFIILLLITGSAVAWIYVRSELSSKKTGYVVATTIFPLYDITKNLVGDSVEVVPILPPGADAHSFEPSPSLILQLQNASAVYQIGHELDEWVVPLAENAGAENVLVDDNITLKAFHKETDEHEHGHEHEEYEDKHHHGPIDPHYWLTCENAKQIAVNITKDLSARFPEQAEIFATNLTAYSDELEKLDQEIRADLKDLPNKNIVTFHDAWYYFADEYGLTVAGTFEPTAGREPTPQHLAELVEKISAVGVKTIYYEPQMSISGYETFANDYNISLKILDDIGGLAPYDSYINLIKTNVFTLQNNQ